MAAKGTNERVTQGFVGTLSSCWRRPSLTAFEVLWRWVYGIPVLLLLRSEGFRVLLATPLDYTGLREMSLLDPMRSSVALAKALVALGPPVRHLAVWLMPLLLLGWIVVSSLGRTAVLKRADLRLHSRPGALILLQTVRMLALAAAFALWFTCLQAAARLTITGPVEQGAEPSLILYFALAIAATLGLFTLWAVGSWGLAVAPLLAMLHGWGAVQSLRKSFHLGPLKIKFVEINLVMGIVKIALIVLAMVFSASPLPFETVASREFLTWWWMGVTVLYLIASDFFHVARLAAYLELLRDSASK